jgi:hypothetical protein
VTSAAAQQQDPAKYTRWKGEWACALLVMCGFAAGELASDGATLLPAIDAGTRADLYTSLAASAAALLGFSITAASILLSLGTGPAIEWLRDQPEFQQTRHIFMGAIRVLAVTTVIFTTLIVADTDGTGVLWFELPGVLFAVLVVLKLERVIWLLDRLLRIGIQNRKGTRNLNPPFTESLGG